MEETITRFGGEVAGEAVKDRCCGGNQIFINKAVTEKLSRLILEKSQGTLVVFCPLCHMALKTFSGDGRSYISPTFSSTSWERRAIMNVLIIGGGISGISAAKVVLKEGHNAVILENTPELGGTMARIANCRIGFKTFYDEIKDDPASSRHQRCLDRRGAKKVERDFP